MTRPKLPKAFDGPNGRLRRRTVLRVGGVSRILAAVEAADEAVLEDLAEAVAARDDDAARIRFSEVWLAAFSSRMLSFDDTPPPEKP